jgi:hypothetical protein
VQAPDKKTWTKPQLVTLTQTSESAAGAVAGGTEGSTTTLGVPGDGPFYIGPSGPA